MPDLPFFKFLVEGRDYLRRQIEWSPDLRGIFNFKSLRNFCRRILVGGIKLFFHLLTEAEVPDPHLFLLIRKENVLSL